MTNATDLHLQRLVRMHGSWSQMARDCNLVLRTLRRNRRAMTPPTRRFIHMAGKRLVLRLLLRELIRSGAVTTADLRAAWEKIPLVGTPNA